MPCHKLKELKVPHGLNCEKSGGEGLCFLGGIKPLMRDFQNEVHFYFCICVCVSAYHLCFPFREEEGADSLELVTGDCEQPTDAENQTHVLWKSSECI